MLGEVADLERVAFVLESDGSICFPESEFAIDDTSEL